VNYLLDTNVLSEWIKSQPDPEVDRWLRTVDEESTCVSVVTFGELRQGVEMMARGRRRDEIESWLEYDLPERFDGRIIDVGLSIAIAWGLLRARTRSAGHPMEGMDAFLAATAQVHGLTLVTRNTKDFERLGISLFNPWLAAN